MKVVAPLIIGRLLSYFTPVPGISKTEAYMMALLLSITDLTQAAIHAPNFFKNQRHGLHLRIAVGTVVYRKVGTQLMYASIGFFVRILPRSKGVFVQGPCIHYNLYVVFILYILYSVLY